MNVTQDSLVADSSSDLKPTQPASTSSLNRRRLLRFGLYTTFVASGCAKFPGNSEDHAAGVTTAGPKSLVPDSAAADQSLKDATQKLQSKCAKLWGTAHAELPAQKVWVSYDKDWISRGHTDFEHGEFVAEALVDADQADDIGPALGLMRKRLEDAQKNTAFDMADDDKVLKLARQLARERGLGLADPPAPVAKGDPVLAGILPADAASRLTAGTLQRTAIVGDDGNPRVMLTYRVNFLDGYHARLAAPYVGAVQREAHRYELQPSLVLAIIETESAFNPRARSGAPAFGLMQLVPNSGGCDAYKHAFGSFRIPDPEYLYVPDNNIRLGSAYVQLLDRRDLHGISNLQSRGYAVVAAYNTGAGNVARAFGGTTRVGPAADAVNKMSPDDVLRHLQERLPFDETRKYLTNVVARRSKYNDLDDDEASSQMM